MVLSDRVARPPPPPDGHAPRRPRDKPAGPFAAMNKTVANIGTIRRGPPNRTRDATPTSMTTRSPAGEGSRDRDSRDKRGRGGKAPFKALNMQRSLATIGYGQRASIKQSMGWIESFDQFSLLPVLKEAISADALKGMTDIKPTPVQRLAIPALLGQRAGPRARSRAGATDDATTPTRQEFLLAAETGSGKTLAYLLPAINALKQAEAEDTTLAAYNERLEKEKVIRGDRPLSSWIENFEPHPNMARPRVIVLVPTAELVEQVTAVAKSLAHAAKFKVRPLSANLNPIKLRNNLYNPLGIDMIVSTPHLLASIAESDPYVLSRVTHLVVDEADSLFDRSFAPETTSIVDRATPSLHQLVLCSATIPKRLDVFLADRFPRIHRITTPNLHAIPRRVQLGVIDVTKDPYRNNKMLACADAIWAIGRDGARHEIPGQAGTADVKRIMVFVNERETTQELADFLVKKGIEAVALHRDNPQRQSEMLASFTSNDAARVPVAAAGDAAADEEAADEVAASSASKPARAPGSISMRHLANTKVIVATDLASRGIDTLAVRHVVLYDVPHTTIDFIHRLGRAGRMGRRGRGIVLVGKSDRRDIVAEVKESMFMGQALV
jgi:ATP-dependent RNA helicase MRH4